MMKRVWLKRRPTKCVCCRYYFILNRNEIGIVIWYSGNVLSYFQTQEKQKLAFSRTYDPITKRHRWVTVASA